MTSSPVAIITPSYVRDFDFCRTLNRTVLEFLPKSVKHYIFVDRRDYRLFRSLAGERTIVGLKEEILPRGIMQIPGTNRWFSASTLIPISGWLVQQIAKIATADVLKEPTLVMVDSDALFVRDVDPTLFAAAGRTRLYQASNAITPEMHAHVEWHNNACRLLDVSPDQPPMNDYIGQVISWDRGIVRQMCARIEAITGRSWHSALARTRQISEYLLYGIFVEKVLGTAHRVWIDEKSRCKTHWEFSPLLDSQLAEFAGSLDADDFAVMIGSHSNTSRETRRSAVEIATNGRIR